MDRPSSRLGVALIVATWVLLALASYWAVVKQEGEGPRWGETIGSPVLLKSAVSAEK